MFSVTLLFVIVTAVFATITFCLVVQSGKRRLRLPPGPKRTAILGNLPQLFRESVIKGQAPFVTFADWAFKHGPICYLEFFRQRVIVISDARVAQQLCVGQAEKFSARPSGLFLARVLKGKGIVFNDGPSWKEHRSFLNHEFRKFGFGHHSLEPRIQHVVDEYLAQIGKTNGLAHDPHLNLATAVYNVIWTVISGEKFEWEDPFLRKLITNLETNLQAVELVGVHNYVTILMLFHLMWHNPWRLLSIVGKRFNYFRKLISDSKEYIKTSDHEESIIQDYLGRIANKDTSAKHTYFSDSQLLWLVSDLFIAGGETTITTLRWLILCLATFPDVQQRIRNEILNNVGSDSSPTYSQRTLLPYTEAFIHEVLRYCGVTPGMWRDTSDDATFQGYDIPKNTWILLHFWAMSHDASQWTDSDAFRPERFLNDDGTFSKRDHFLAFSTGRRQCPGEGLARTELFLFTTGIVQKFRVSLPADGAPVDIGAGHFGVTYTPPKFQVRFTPVANADGASCCS